MRGDDEGGGVAEGHEDHRGIRARAGVPHAALRTTAPIYDAAMEQGFAEADTGSVLRGARESGEGGPTQGEEAMNFCPAGADPHQARERRGIHGEARRERRGARKEPGCKQFDVVVDPKDRASVMLYEVYADEKAFEQHQQTAAFRKYVAEAVPLLASRERHIWKRVD